MKNQEERTREQMMLFRMVNGGQPIEKGVMSIDLVKSKTRVRFVKVDTDLITWKRPGKNGNGFTSSIELNVAKRIEKLKLDSFRVRVDYVGGPPVVGGIRAGNGKDGAVAAGEAEDPANRTERRFKKLDTVESMSDANKKYYKWFTLLDALSDEEVIAANLKPAGAKAGAAAPRDGKVDVASMITNLRADLLANLTARATGARTGDDALVCTPEFTSDVAVGTLLIHERVFMKVAAAAAAAKDLTGGIDSRRDLERAITEAFLAFCQGDLRIVDELSDLNVEPDSAMVFLFAEYALTLLQVVGQFGAPGSEGLENPQAKAVAERLFADANHLHLWKRVAASFVLGQRVYMRAYAPHRLNGPAHIGDYVRTNFDPTEKLDADELKELRARYDKLKFSKKKPPLADAVLRSVFWRHAMNAVEAFPGSLEDERSDELGDLMLPAVDKPDQSATVSLRALRGADPSIRRHVRHEVASVATVPTGIGATDNLGKLGIKGPRLESLAKMLAAYASAPGRRVEPEDLEITESSTVDSIALRLNERIAPEVARKKTAS